MTEPAVIRQARPADVPAIYQMICDLAEYERSRQQVTGTSQELQASLFGPRPAVFAHVAEHDGHLAGFALWYLNYSTWLCQHGIYLEDLYVRPELRGHGHGRALLAELAAICVQRGYGRLEWWVLNWNEPAIGFYASLGATAMDQWAVQRLSGPALHALAADRDPGR